MMWCGSVGEEGSEQELGVGERLRVKGMKVGWEWWEVLERETVRSRV